MHVHTPTDTPVSIYVCACLPIQLPVLACIHMSVHMVTHTSFETRKDGVTAQGRGEEAEEEGSLFLCTSLMNPARN